MLINIYLLSYKHYLLSYKHYKHYLLNEEKQKQR